MAWLRRHAWQLLLVSRYDWRSRTETYSRPACTDRTLATLGCGGWAIWLRDWIDSAPGAIHEVGRRERQIEQAAAWSTALVEPDESLRQAAGRKVAEEVGLVPQVGRLLVVNWSGPQPPKTEGLSFVFDGGGLGADEIERIVLPADELTAFEFVPDGCTGGNGGAQPAAARRLGLDRLRGDDHSDAR